MAYNKKTWLARLGQGLNKFSIDGATPVPIINQPDSVTQQGDALSAGNLNDLEQRIADAFDDVEESKADKSTTDALQSQINQHDARLQNLEQKAGDYSIVQYRGTDAVPTGKASYGLVKNIVGKTRAWNQLVDTDTSSVTLISGHKYLTVINGSFSIVTGAGTAISVTGGTDCVYDLTLIFGAGNEPATVADALTALPALGQYNSYDAGSLVSTTVEGVKAVGVNLCNTADSVNKRINSDGTVSDSIYWGTANSAIDVRPFSTITISANSSINFFRIAEYDADETFIKTTDSSGTSFTLTLSANTSKIKWGLNYNGASTVTKAILDSVELQLQYGSSRTTFYPYHAPVTLSLPSVTLRSDGSYPDVVQIDSGNIDRNCIEIDLTTFVQSGNLWLGSNNTAYPYGGRNAIFVCSNPNYVGGSWNSIGSVNNEIAVSSTGMIALCLLDTSESPTGKIVIRRYEPTTESIAPTVDNTILTEGGGTINTMQTQTPVIDNCLDVGYLAL